MPYPTDYPGETFETPWLALGYSAAGFGPVSRNLHRYQPNHILPRTKAADLRPVLYNSWEAVFFYVNEATQMPLAEKAARLGVELFVVDDATACATASYPLLWVAWVSART